MITSTVWTDGHKLLEFNSAAAIQGDITSYV